jgi:D-psicose/D-tagatose/L-ribulose 3-epimerase
MNIGINLLLWTATPTPEHFDLLQDIKSWGYDSVELPMFGHDSSPWTEMAKHLDDLGLARTAVTVAHANANPIAEDAAVRRAAVDHVKACVDSCVTLGANVLCGPICSPVGALVGRGRTDQEWAWAVEFLNEAGQHAAAAGVVLGVEPLNRFETYFINCASDSARLIDEVGLPSVGILYDTFHSNIEEKDPIASIGVVGHRIAQFHVSENDRGTPGEGHIPWPQVFRALKATGYDGSLTVEAFGRALPELAAATCIWRQMFQDEETLARNACRFIRESW